MLQRMLKYSRTHFDLWRLLDGITDRRPQPEIPTNQITRTVVVMNLARMGSLNAVKMSKDSSFWNTLLDNGLPSPDTIGRVNCGVPAGDVRKVIRALYTSMRRKKVPLWTIRGLSMLVLDGHESHCSCLQKCSGCLARTHQLKNGEERTEYYHRHIMGLLIMRDFCFLLDVEPQKSGEDEVAAATRMLTRLCHDYPRAFDVVAADGLYTRSNFFNLVTELGKYVLTILKNEERHLFKDALGLCDLQKPITIDDGSVMKTIWDLEELTSWDGIKGSVRVVRSLELSRVKRQRTKKNEEIEREWWFATTIPSAIMPAGPVVEFGHGRWAIENQGFNETVNQWKANHVYRHDENAMLIFLLLMIISYNLFHLYFWRNLKEAYRKTKTKLHILCLITAELYASLCQPKPAPA
ncbi:MAG: transposase [Candidatus Margulisiibacteriota bacterium]